jgi:hypothetical protein
MKIYLKNSQNLFGESVIEVMNSKMEFIVDLGDAHAKKMERLNLSPEKDSDIVKFLKHQYSEDFPTNSRILIKWL